MTHLREAIGALVAEIKLWPRPRRQQLYRDLANHLTATTNQLRTSRETANRRTT